MQQIGFFIAKPIVCSTCFGHHYAHHQELKSIMHMAAACGTWLCKDGKCNLSPRFNDDALSN
jgi:hypothetical protein